MNGNFYLFKEREWVGHYVQDGAQHEMKLGSLKIKGEKISGRGEDVNGHFLIDGRIAPHGELEFQKQYIGKHTVHYKGTLNYLVITGTWAIPDYGIGDAFMLSRAISEDADDSSDSE